MCPLSKNEWHVPWNIYYYHWWGREAHQDNLWTYQFKLLWICTTFVDYAYKPNYGFTYVDVVCKYQTPSDETYKSVHP